MNKCGNSGGAAHAYEYKAHKGLKSKNYFNSGQTQPQLFQHLLIHRGLDSWSLDSQKLVHTTEEKAEVSNT